MAYGTAASGCSKKERPACACKPGSVRAAARTAARFRHYLRLQSPAGSSGLPPGSGRATLECRYTWPCNPQVVRPRVSPRRAVGSYPAFSPLPRTGAVVFCYLDCALTDIYPLGSAVLCVARTFLSPSRGSGGTSRRALRAAKVVIIGGNPTASPDYSASGRSDGGAFGRCPKRRGGPSAER